MDGSLATAISSTLPTYPSWNTALGSTWHSAVSNNLFRPSECVYVTGVRPTSNNGALCNPAVAFRRVALSGAAPAMLQGSDVNITDASTNRSAYVRVQVRRKERKRGGCLS